jgi:serine/threonine-protein kinase
MHLESTEDLLQALRASELFTPEQFDKIVRDVRTAGTDVSAVMKQLVKRDRVTVYQFKKILHGKVEDLRVGPYIVTDKLGEGGMGKVFRARLAGEGPTVALKVVRPALVSNPVVRGRYAREVQAAGKLDHPNIVRVLDAGEANGKFYMAMEFVDGIDLARMMRDFGVLEVAEACEYIRQAALGLQHAHEMGFVHRDIKPSNIVVAGERHLPQATEPAVVKLLDLGLARAIDPDDMVAPDLTRDHTVVGTPDYMAPEQAKNSKQVDPRADLYSLGCTLYFLLTGRVPFLGATAIQKILAHQSELPPPVQALRRETPTAVAEIISKLMAKRPEDRFQTAAELAAALEPYARYPAGALPVTLTRVRTQQRGNEDTGRRGDTSMGRSFPSFGSSVGSISPLGLSLDDSQPKPQPKAQPVAPSDNTPRPAEVPSKPAVKEPKSGINKSAQRKPRRAPSPPAQREIPTFVWVAFALFGVVILGLMLWLVSSPR